MRRRITTHIWLLCALTLAVLAVFGGVYWQLAATRHSQGAEEQAARALRELGWLMSDIREADSEGQSFLYGSDERYLDSYHTALARAEVRVASLQEILSDGNEEQLSRVA